MKIITEFCRREGDKDKTIKRLEDEVEKLKNDLSRETYSLEKTRERYKTLEDSKNELDSVYQKSKDQLIGAHRDELERLTAAHREELKLRDAEREQLDSAKLKIQELNNSIEQLRASRNELADQLRDSKAEYVNAIRKSKEQLASEKAIVSALRQKADTLRQDLGSLFEESSELYRHFKESSWVNDTAMQQLYGENYSIFFARCSSQPIVTEFHRELSSIISRMDEEYIKLADALLDFCAAACTQINRAKYSRLETQEGDDFQSQRHVSCSKGNGGKISRVFLRGIAKEGQPIMRSYVERGE